jgi:hypothetical protein
MITFIGTKDVQVRLVDYLVVECHHYITIATTGNATDFGDLDTAIDTGSATSNNTRGIFSGGNSNPGTCNVIQYVTIDTTGNATDFGDLTHDRQNLASLAGS